MLQILLGVFLGCLIFPRIFSIIFCDFMFLTISLFKATNLPSLLPFSFESSYSIHPMYKLPHLCYISFLQRRQVPILHSSPSSFSTLEISNPKFELTSGHHCRYLRRTPLTTSHSNSPSYFLSLSSAFFSLLIVFPFHPSLLFFFTVVFNATIM